MFRKRTMNLKKNKVKSVDFLILISKKLIGVPCTCTPVWQVRIQKINVASEG